MKYRYHTLSFCLLAVCVQLQAQGIVESIVKSPVTTNGNVAGQPTDLVVNLNFSDLSFAEFLNPAVLGGSLAAGNTLTVVLPDEFTIDPSVPVSTITSSDTCTPGNVQCNTGFIVQGQPQRPILPILAGDTPTPVYSVTLSDVGGQNAFVFTADSDLGPGSAVAGAGIKGIHLVTPGVTNPPAGEYEIEVIAQTGPGGTEQRGSALVTILESTQPSINVVSVFNEGNPNTIFQSTGLGAPTPLAHDFLLWGADDAPIVGAEIEMQSPELALIRTGDTVIGNITIEGPLDGGHRLLTEQIFNDPVNGPLFGTPAGRFRSVFEAGNVPGDFTITYNLDGGTSARMFVSVVPEPSSFGLLGIALLIGASAYRKPRIC